MSFSPPGSPPPPTRPLSGVFQTGRSSSRLSISSKQGGGSRASDEDGKTSVKVGEWKQLVGNTIGIAGIHVLMRMLVTASCQSPSAITTVRSRFRTRAAAFPTLDGPRYLSNQLGCGRRARFEEDVRL